MATDGTLTGYPELVDLLPVEFTLDRFAEALRAEFVQSRTRSPACASPAARAACPGAGAAQPAIAPE